jgi:hypothetical protein
MNPTEARQLIDKIAAKKQKWLRACPGIHFLGVSRRVIKPIMAM